MTKNEINTMKQTKNHLNSTGAIIGSFAIGAAIGLLLFPRKGNRVVSKIKKESREIKDVMKLKMYSFMEEIRKELDMAVDKANNYMQMEKALNAKILKITLKLQNEYPEIYANLEEMPVTIPDSNDPEVNLTNLKKYYNSLEIILKNYIKTPKQNNN